MTIEKYVTRMRNSTEMNVARMLGEVPVSKIAVDRLDYCAQNL